MKDLTAHGAKALLLNGQVVGRWTLGNPKQEKLTGARKKSFLTEILPKLKANIHESPGNW